MRPISQGEIKEFDTLYDMEAIMIEVCQVALRNSYDVEKLDEKEKEIKTSIPEGLPGIFRYHLHRIGYQADLYPERLTLMLQGSVYGKIHIPLSMSMRKFLMVYPSCRIISAPLDIIDNAKRVKMRIIDGILTLDPTPENLYNAGCAIEQAGINKRTWQQKSTGLPIESGLSDKGAV